MIIVTLKGGLGNQLFQYAAGRALAIQRGEELLLDLSFLSKDPHGAYTRRQFELDQIKFKARVASDEELRRFGKTTVVSRVLNKFKLTSHYVFNENGYAYIPGFNRLPNNVLLNGYWQSEKYFKSVRGTLLKEIAPNFEFTDAGRSIKNQIDSVNSVSIHVRRGDFITLKNAHEFHGGCDMTYYSKAIEKINSLTNDPVFFIFSDDISWCKSRFSFIHNAHFIENEPAKKSAQDLFLMSYCKHNIIANSSYSWWAAWLNSNPNHKVLMPSSWYKEIKSDTIDIVSENWIVV
ncbi:MAG: alpha-1,2-fucosyltransferase [Bacteroidetes bacterium]|nr:alpha-1,2-fucosyltransferase [Bacteroidota bacterium]